nr:hypothetical protein [Tanacetum cinerariifolium]
SRSDQVTQFKSTKNERAKIDKGLTNGKSSPWVGKTLRIVLSIEDELNNLEQPISLALVAPAGQQVAPEILAAHNAWIKGSKEIVGLMLMTMEPEIQRNLEPFHAHEMLRTLEEELSSVFKRVTEKEKNAASGAGGS